MGRRDRSEVTCTSCRLYVKVNYTMLGRYTRSIHGTFPRTRHDVRRGEANGITFYNFLFSLCPMIDELFGNYLVWRSIIPANLSSRRTAARPAAFARSFHSGGAHVRNSAHETSGERPAFTLCRTRLAEHVVR